MSRFTVALLAFTSIVVISGCSTKKAVICEGWGELDCPKHFVELEASDLYRPVGLISEKITSCIAYTDNNVSLQNDGFVCREYFK